MTTQTLRRYELYQAGRQGDVGDNQHVLLLAGGGEDRAFARCPPERMYGFLSPEQTVGVRRMMSEVTPTMILGGEEADLAQHILDLEVSPGTSPELTRFTQSLLGLIKQ